jgi:type IV secretory pathway ATPase VirB11/archaellum biosynthesis ATPase
VTDVTLLSLVQNNTLDEHIAALLWTIAEEKRWLVTAAVPRKAGKSTVLNAALQFAPPGTPIHRLTGEIGEIRELRSRPDGGYLEVGEISTEPPKRYIWGEPVTALFETLAAGFSLATTMHAPDIDNVISQISDGNGISDRALAKLNYVVLIERHGETDDTYWRRVTGVYEVAKVVKGKPVATLLHRWAAQGDRFEQLARPKLLTATPATLAVRASRIREVVAKGQTAPEHAAQLASARP